MVQLSNEWREKANAKLADASTGIFFQTTEPRLIPTFDRPDDDDNNDGKFQYISHIIFNICDGPSDSSSLTAPLITPFLLNK
eukprot:scaffold2865_cov146-Skeletonema_menzelii.AAC.1